ncbi:MAG: NADH-quinone oxidoreductase subunit F [Candidatus Poribacteria bacterium]|nr:MAG: NADH-quinone oxidoreductase subunit F [Candidatus Poribacteria bacterium]
MGTPKELRILYENIDLPGMYTLEVYQQHGGYKSLEKLFEIEPDALIEMVKESGLRGRGGAGFSTGLKWSFVPKDVEPKYLCANADESEPGTFSNRYILQQKPHMLIEGIIIACWALGIHTAYVYVRGEFTLGKKRLDAAIAEAYQAGLLGKNIRGTGFDLDVYTHPGAGAYICGEETGLIESLEGKRGQPRNKPPFPAVQGLFMKPTVVQNVETLSNLPFIVQNGVEWYKNLGTIYKDTPRGVDPMNTGTKLYCVSGHVERPGVYEVEMGLTVRELIEMAGGVRGGRQVKAVIPGGSSAPVLTPYELDVPCDFTCLQMNKTMLGSGGVIVMDETVNTVEALLNLMEFYAHESCGQCTPCRNGTPWVRDITRRIFEGRGKPGDVDHLIEVANMIADVDAFTWNTICVFGIAVAWPAVSFARKFRPEFEAHIREGRPVVLPVEEAVTPPEENYAWPQTIPEAVRRPTWDY